jgi:hypothetical protein
VTAVRPPLFPPSPALQPTRPDAGRQAAQKAFFDLALGKPAAPQSAAAIAPAPVAAPSRAAAPLPEIGAEKPQKILRPGSLLDIRV